MAQMRSQEPLSADAHMPHRTPCKLCVQKYCVMAGIAVIGKTGASFSLAHPGCAFYSRSNGQTRAAIGHALKACSRSQRLAIGDGAGWAARPPSKYMTLCIACAMNKIGNAPGYPLSSSSAREEGEEMLNRL